MERVIRARRIVSLAALGALAAFAAPATDVRFAPADGTELTKNFALELALEGGPPTMTFDGNEIEAEVPDMSLSFARRGQVTDRYERVADGRPQRLVRRYDALTMGVEDDQRESDLAGLSVVFAWDADLEEYEARWPEDDEHDDELLEGLWEDMDLRTFLPSGAVAEGDTWSLDADAVRPVLVAGGDLELSAPPAEGGAEEGSGAIRIEAPSLPVNPLAWIADLEGGGEATFEGVREEDGTEVAVIAVSIDVTASNDLTDYFEESGGGEFDVAMLDVAIEVEGELLWDVAAGRLHALDLEGDLDADFEVSMSILDGVHTFETRQEVSGDIAIRAGLGEREE